MTSPAAALPGTPVTTVTPDRLATERDRVRPEAGRRALAALRLATGFIFLWAFLDTALGLGYATPPERA